MPLTLDQLQTRFEADMGLVHQFLHGLDTEQITTEGGLIPTVAKAVKNLPAGAQGPAGPKGDKGTSLKVLGTLINESALYDLVNPAEADTYVIGGFFWTMVSGVWTNLGDFRGNQGLSAYEVALANGFIGTLSDWVTSLKGAEGIGLRIKGSLPGTYDLPNNATQGDAYIINYKMYVWDTVTWSPVGQVGATGLSAYQLAVAQGFVGTVPTWLASLKGLKGDAGLKGDTGLTGGTGPMGPGVKILGTLTDTGLLPAGGIVAEGYLIAGDFWGWTGSAYENMGKIQGPAGPTGLTGPQGLTGPAGPTGEIGRSAYTIATDNGFIGTMDAWLLSLKGTRGDDGLRGFTGTAGTNGTNGKNFAILGTFATVDQLPLTPADNDSYLVGTNLHTYITGAWVDLGPFKGDKGDTGLTGLKGDTGADGIRGSIGAGLIPKGTVTDTAALNAIVGASLGDTYFIDAIAWSFDGTTWVNMGNVRGLTGLSAFDIAKQAVPALTTVAEYLIYLKGDKGDTGAGIQGVEGQPGIQGPEGAIGPMGPGITILGLLVDTSGLPGTGTLGSGYMIGMDFWGWTGAAYENLGNIKGPKGDRGVIGPTGLTGPKGDKGEIGTKWVILDRDPSAADGVNGDSFLNIITQQIFLKISTVTWAYQGTLGIAGTVGPKGDVGAAGADGKSAYQIAVIGGFVGTEAEWLLSLKGAKGDTGLTGLQGTQGIQGVKGDTGLTGKSAYELAVVNGFVGTEADWLLSLKGVKGDTGLQGIQGIQGTQGIQGVKGDTGATGAQGTPGITGPQSLTGSFPGPVTPQVGTQTFYPRTAISVSNIAAWLSSAATATVSATIKKNGAAAQTVSIPVGSTKVNTATTINLTVDDYLTIDVVGGTGNDLTIRLDY